MRRLLAWISGATGGVVAYRLLSRRSAPGPELPPAPAEPDPRAAELRAKLEQAGPAQAPEASAAGDPAAAPAPAPADSAADRVPEGTDADGRPAADDAGAGEGPEARRRRVHERARAAVDEMRRPPSGSP